jgi:hypothetical protein
MPYRCIAKRCCFAVLVLSVLLPGPLAWAESVFLDELDLTKSKCGWNETRAKRSVGGNPLRAGGVEYARGVGTHPPGHIAVKLDGKAVRFVALVALDDEVGNKDRHFFKLYENLGDDAFFYDNASWTEPKTYPGRFGASASKLYQILRDDHYGVDLPSVEMKRLTLWLDCNSDFYGAYDACERQRAGEIVIPKLE